MVVKWNCFLSKDVVKKDATPYNFETERLRTKRSDPWSHSGLRGEACSNDPTSDHRYRCLRRQKKEDFFYFTC